MVKVMVISNDEEYFIIPRILHVYSAKKSIPREHLYPPPFSFLLNLLKDSQTVGFQIRDQSEGKSHCHKENGEEEKCFSPFDDQKMEDIDDDDGCGGGGGVTF
jgi:hypothetical protein